MEHTVVLLPPVTLLAFWTLLVLNIVGVTRVVNTLRGDVGIKEFALGETDHVPEWTRRANRNLINLLEVPVLFYVACIVATVASVKHGALIPLAWGYVALRIAHSLVHLTTNNIVHRLVVFGASNLVLIVVWVILALRL